MKPNVGDIVHFGAVAGIKNSVIQLEPRAAIITKVIDDKHVNLRVFHPVLNVVMMRTHVEFSSKPARERWSWRRGWTELMDPTSTAASAGTSRRARRPARAAQESG
jgi:hypothetical protein